MFVVVDSNFMTIKEPMKYLNLSHNKLELIHPDALPYVSILDISYNNLKYIPQYFDKKEEKDMYKWFGETQCGGYRHDYSVTHSDVLLDT